MREPLETLIAAAGKAASERRWSDAERIWSDIRAQDPRNVQALYSLGVHAHQRGDGNAALSLLREAQAEAPHDPMIALTLGVVHRQRGDAVSEWSQITASLTIDAYFLPGLLAKAEFLERQGYWRAAASVFRDVLKVAPEEAAWPPQLQRRLAHAQRAVRRDRDDLSAFLTREVSAQQQLVEPMLAGRWEEALSIISGHTRPFLPQCNQLYIPRLPAQPFHDPALFPWIPALEARADAIRAELEILLAGRLKDFQPYIAYRPDQPVNQWGALNHSSAWSSFHLWAHGQPVDANLAQCPVTAQALSEVGMARIAGLCPNAMFSALAPHTHIPPHHGETNARLVAHLPLVVPPDCNLRVGFDRRQWEPGKVLIFDDSIEHEARNDSDALRVVLIFDVWNPLLSNAERDMVTALSDAMRRYRDDADVGPRPSL